MTCLLRSGLLLSVCSLVCARAEAEPEIVPADNEPRVLAAPAPGKVGACLRLEQGGWVEAPVPERLRVTGQLTIDAWVRPKLVDDGRNQIILAMHQWVSPGAYCFHVNDKHLDKSLAFMAYNRAGVAKSVVWQGGLQAGRWLHAVVVYDGAEMRLYVDGDLKGSTPHAGELGAAGPIRLSDHRPAGPWFAGCIDELKIYDTALPVDDSGNVPADAAPVLHWSFDAIAGQRVLDVSGHGAHGRLNTPRPPREMVESGRREKRRPLVDFEDLRDWEVALHHGARCTLRRSQAKRMWGRNVAEIVYAGASRASFCEIRPKTPIPIPGEFDCVNLWVHGDWWGHSAGRRTMGEIGITPASLAVRVIDATGETHELNLGRIDAADWFLFHGKFAPERWKGAWGGATYRSRGGDGDGVVDFPAEFASLVLRPCADEAPRRIHLDSLSFYREELKPIPAAQPPAQLPFPTTPDTILPTCKAAYANHVVERDGEYVFEYRGKDCDLQYVYRPTDGSLSDITTVYNDAFRFRPCNGGGLAVEVEGALVPAAEARQNAEFLSAGLQGNRLLTRWRWEVRGRTVAFELDLAIKGKSLVIDYRAAGGEVAQVVFGRTLGTPAPKLIDVPYLVVDGWERNKAGPFVVYSNGLFVLGLVDWYNSDGSKLFGDRRPVTEDSAAFNGGVQYERRTDGRRNDVRERLFLTVSPDFHEVLPNIPNPPSPHRALAARHIYAMLGSRRPEYVTLLSNYGLDRLMCQHHEPIWHEGASAFSSTYKPVPELGVDGLKQYSQFVRDAGCLFGLYTCFTDRSPSNEVWSEDSPCLTPDGAWRRGWFACYRTKPSLALAWQSPTAERLHREFNTQTVYCDVHTCVAPWSVVDYDARVPAAAKFRPVFEAYGALLLNEQRVHGPTFSEGHYHWLYAGLPTGNYASICGTDAAYKMPLLPDFDLLKMHPLQTDIGMGHSAFIFFGRYEQEWRADGHCHNRWFSQHLAATIAYGHIGALFDLDAWGFSGICKQYFMLQQLQQRYATDEVEAIRYHDGAAFVKASAALAGDVHRRGRFYVKYRQGLEIFVNYNARENWEVRADGASYDLPPYGFFAWKPDDILAFSAFVQGKRVEYVDSPAYLYADTWDVEAALPKLRLRGAAAVKRGSDRDWWVIPVGDLHCNGLSATPGPARGCPKISLRLGALFDPPPGATEVWACSEGGVPQSRFPADTADGWLTFEPSTDVPKYRIAPSR